jgi:hypothetical protein
MPGAAVAEQPMDRFERLMEQGKAADVVTQARKWLERNIVDDRREAVVLLLHEASYAEVLATPSVAAAQAYQARSGPPRPRRLGRGPRKRRLRPRPERGRATAGDAF